MHIGLNEWKDAYWPLMLDEIGMFLMRWTCILKRTARIPFGMFLHLHVDLLQLLTCMLDKGQGQGQ